MAAQARELVADPGPFWAAAEERVPGLLACDADLVRRVERIFAST